MSDKKKKAPAASTVDKKAAATSTPKKPSTPTKAVDEVKSESGDAQPQSNQPQENAGSLDFEAGVVFSR